MRQLTALAMAVLATVPGVAQSAETQCLTPREFSALAGYSLPSVISGTSQRCGPSLGPKAFLRTSGKELANRYAARKANDWPAAKAAFLKLSASSSDAAGAFKGMPDASLQQVLSAMMEGMVAQQIPLDRCGAIDDLVRLLSPLPAQNTAELIALAVGLGAKSAKAKSAKVGPVNLCPA